MIDVEHPSGEFNSGSLFLGQVNEASKLIPKDLTNKITIHNTQLGVLNRRQGTISGAHKQDSFLESIEITGAKVNLTTTDKKYPGLIEYKYQIPAVNNKGQQIGFKTEQTKTTYDPAIRHLKKRKSSSKIIQIIGNIQLRLMVTGFK